MKFLKKIVVMTIALCFDPAFGGHELGNGASAIVCRDATGTIKNSQLFDYYEAEVLRGMPIDLGVGEASPLQKSLHAFERLRRLDPQRTDNYVQRAHEFLADAVFLPNTTLTSIDDVKAPAIPNGCMIEQLAIRQQKRFPYDKSFLISKDIWDTLDENSKSGLILHEIIYEELFEHGDLTSKNSRYFNSLLASGAINLFSLTDYFSLLESFGVPLAYQSDTLFLSTKNNSYSFREDGLLASAELIEKSDYKLENGYISLPKGTIVDFLSDPNRSFIIKGADGELVNHKANFRIKISAGDRINVQGSKILGEIYAYSPSIKSEKFSSLDYCADRISYALFKVNFYSNLEIESMVSSECDSDFFTSIYSNQTRTVFDSGRGMRFYENGSVKNGYLSESGGFHELKVKDGWVGFSGEVSFYSNGLLKSGKLNVENQSFYEFTIPSGEKKRIQNGSFISFDENGYLIQK